MTKHQILNRIAAGLGEPALRGREYRPAEARSLIAAAEQQVARHYGTDMHEGIAMWFAGLLAELDTAN